MALEITVNEAENTLEPTRGRFFLGDCPRIRLKGFDASEYDTPQLTLFEQGLNMPLAESSYDKKTGLLTLPLNSESLRAYFNGARATPFSRTFSLYLNKKRRADTGLFVDGNIRRVVSANGQTVIAMDVTPQRSAAGLYKSIDSIETVYQIPGNVSQDSFQSIATDGEGTWLAVSDVTYRVFISTDDGETFRVLREESRINDSPITAYHHDGRWYVAFFDGRIEYTDDLENWTVAQVLGSPYGLYAINNTSIMLAGAWSRGVYRSSDRGATWNKVSTGELDDSNVVAFCTAKGITIACEKGDRACRKGLWRSTDSGETWTPVDDAQLTDGSGETARSFYDCLYANGVFMAVGPDGAFASRDGIDWVRCSEGSYKDIDFQDGKFICYNNTTNTIDVSGAGVSKENATDILAASFAPVEEFIRIVEKEWIYKPQIAARGLVEIYWSPTSYVPKASKYVSMQGEKMTFSDLTAEEKNELKLKFSDLTDAEKATLKLTFADLTEEEKESLRGEPGDKGDPGDTPAVEVTSETLKNAVKDLASEDDLVALRLRVTSAENRLREIKALLHINLDGEVVPTSNPGELKDAVQRLVLLVGGNIEQQGTNT